jgi:hypothetical protein
MTNETQENERNTQNTTKVRCQGITLKNEHCTRLIDKNKKYCWQHRFTKQNRIWCLYPQYYIPILISVVGIIIAIIIFTYQNKTGATKNDLAKLPQQLEKHENKNRIGLLKPRNKIEPSSRPELPGVFHSEAEYGGIWNIHIQNDASVLPFGPYVPFSIKKTTDGLLISLIIYDWDRKIVAEIINNRWTRNPPLSWRYNYDDSSLEIIDNYRIPVLQIEYIDNYTIRFAGVFRSGNDPVSEEYPDFPCDLENAKGIFEMPKNSSIFVGRGKTFGPAYPAVSQLQTALTIARKMIWPWFDYSNPEVFGKRLPDSIIQPLISNEEKQKYVKCSNEQLKEIAIQFTKSLSGFVSNFKEANKNDDFDIDDFLSMSQEEQERILQQQRTRDLKRFEHYLNEYKDKFQKEAIIFRDAFIERLPLEPKYYFDYYLYENPTNMIGVQKIMEDLERLIEKLE